MTGQKKYAIFGKYGTVPPGSACILQQHRQCTDFRGYSIPFLFPSLQAQNNLGTSAEAPSYKCTCIGSVVMLFVLLSTLPKFSDRSQCPFEHLWS